MREAYRCSHAGEIGRGRQEVDVVISGRWGKRIDAAILRKEGIKFANIECSEYIYTLTRFG